MSGKARILAALRRGPVRAHDWAANAPDGGKPIQRVGARILDLRRDGYAIETVETSPSALYRLVNSSPAQVSGATVDGTGQPSTEISPNEADGDGAAVGLIPNVASAGIAAAMAEFDDEDGEDWWEEAA